MYRLYSLLVPRLRLDAFHRDVLATFLTKIIIAGFTLLALALIGRRLGSEGKGLFELAILLPNMLGLLLGGGVYLANAYLVGRQQFDVATLTSHSISFTLISTALGIVIVTILLLTGLLTRLMAGVPAPLLLVGTLLLPIQLLGNAFQGILQGKQKILRINAVGLVRVFIFFLLVLFALLALNGSASEMVLAFLLSYLIQTLVFARMVQQMGGQLRPRWQGNVVRKALGFGLRAQVGNILQFYNYRLDVFILNLFLGASSVGIYNVSVQFSELLWFLPNAIGYVILPKAAASTKVEMDRFTPRIFLATLGISAIAGVILALIGHPLIVVLFGQDFSAAYLPLLALLPGVVLLGSAKVLMNEITGRGYPQYNSITTGIALVVTVLLDLRLIPGLGLLGAAIASTCAYGLTWMITIIFFQFIRYRSAAP